MRFCAAQFEALLSENLWLYNASNANAMAQRLRDAVEAIEASRSSIPSRRTPSSPARPRRDRPPARSSEAEHPFYIWDEAENIVRWMCAWDTTAEDVDAFAAAVEDAAAP